MSKIDKLCMKCKHECKQVFEVYRCDIFEPKEDKKKEIKQKEQKNENNICDVQING